MIMTRSWHGLIDKILWKNGLQAERTNLCALIKDFLNLEFVGIFIQIFHTLNTLKVFVSVAIITSVKLSSDIILENWNQTGLYLLQDGVCSHL